MIPEILSNAYERAIFILSQPIHNENLLWILIPLFLTLILMELYFGRYEKEELGWNTAFGNSLILIFVSANLINHLVNNNLWADPIKTGVILTLILIGFILTLLDYFHALPEKLAFAVSSKFPISFIAFLAILFVYIDIPIDQITLLAFVLIFIAAYIIISIIHFLTPTFHGLMSQEVPEPI
jgi:hypothetical protein